MSTMPDAPGGLSLVHAHGPRTVFRPDGVLDVLAYHLDPGVLPSWVEADLLELAEQVRDAAGVDVDLRLVVRPGRTGPTLVEAGEGAQLLVVGRGEPPFVRRHALAPYLRHALVHASCPVAVVPAPETS
jgi:nucleotide-binding universal stress UspA family protein